jgi:hypothetical protein
MLWGVWIRPSLLLIMALIFYLFRFTWMIVSLVALLTLVSRFQEMMESEFQMSIMGELIFFLGIQVKQRKQGTFVHQAKYTKDLMKKFNMAELKAVSTPMSSVASLGPDEDGEAVDQREYRSMIGSLLYLTATRPDIQFVMELCAHFQASPRSSHQTAIQRVFRYLKHTPEMHVETKAILPYLQDVIR